MLYGFQGNDIATRKACFQHPEAGLFAFFLSSPLWATTLARDSPPSEGPGGGCSPSLLGRAGVGLYFTTTFFPLRI